MLNVRDNLHAFAKRFLSNRRKIWDLEDYPIRFKRFETPPVASSGRWQSVAWSAQVLNWWQMSGHGNTKEEALADLRASFVRFREAHAGLPRPGKETPLEFAGSELIQGYPALARDFMNRILGLDYDECFISDESSLWDFGGEETNAGVHRRISLLYGVDVSDVEDAKLVRIFERIAEHRRGVRSPAP